MDSTPEQPLLFFAITLLLEDMWQFIQKCHETNKNRTKSFRIKRHSLFCVFVDPSMTVKLGTWLTTNPAAPTFADYPTHPFSFQTVKKFSSILHTMKKMCIAQISKEV